jgi:flagellar hook assembly protein FlgD
MKFLLIGLIFNFLFIFGIKAQSDTLLIKLKNNQIERIAVSQIQKIQFENITSVNDQQLSARGLILKGNNPNPFQEFTYIEFEIASTGNVSILIYDNTGNQIQILQCLNCQPGKNSLQWNCLDKNNNKVQSGAYFYEVKFNNELQSKKMIVIK